MPVLPTTNNKARIVCNTFNHASYIKDAMDGFCMQKTNFPFVAIIIDDASTDGEPEIISQYLEDHFDMVHAQYDENDDAKRMAAVHKNNLNCHFLVILLKYNFYNIKKAQYPLYKGWHENVPYIAMCEGDDYWKDPLKLQKQVDYLEGHPNYTMTCNRVKLFSEKHKKYIGEDYCYTHDRTIKNKDIIYRSGLFISTCSMVYRKSLSENYPEYCRKCFVGDYPFQIFAAMKGKVFYFNDIMSVYRIDNGKSWMSKQNWNSVSDYNLKRIDSMISMFEGFSCDYPRYRKYFQNKIACYLISQSPLVSINDGKDYSLYKEYFHSYYRRFSFYWRVIDKLKCINIPKIRGLIRFCLAYIFKSYSLKRIIYNQ